MRKIAVDANLLVRNAARRLILGTAELTGYGVIVPETADLMSRQVYRKVRGNGARAQVMYEMIKEGKDIHSEEGAERLKNRLDLQEAGFARWLDTEPERNDGVLERGLRTEQTRKTAAALLAAGVVEDAEDTRFGTGEDPQVLAEALEAGAQWIASDNLKTIVVGAMERWLDKEQVMGRYMHVPRPFILQADEAVGQLLKEHDPQRMSDPWQAEVLRIAVCAALCESESRDVNVENRVWNLGRFGSGVVNGGARDTGGLVRRWTRMAKMRLDRGRRAEVVQDLARMSDVVSTKQVARTREAEARRLSLEQGGTGSPNPMSPQESAR